MNGAPARTLRVLVVDDEPQIRRALASVLKARGYAVDLAPTAEQALELAAEHRPDLVVLDLTLPGMTGLEACRQLREWYNGPILVLSVRDSDADKVAALDLGADDYLTKPFSTAELLARLRALSRRASGEEVGVPEVRVGGLRVDFPRRLVTVDGEQVRLTRIEFDILSLLVRNVGRVITSKMLIEKVWGPEYVGDTTTLRAHVSHLRQKIEPRGELPRYIMTEPGVGFRLAEPEDERTG